MKNNQAKWIICVSAVLALMLTVVLTVEVSLQPKRHIERAYALAEAGDYDATQDALHVIREDGADEAVIADVKATLLAALLENGAYENVETLYGELPEERHNEALSNEVAYASACAQFDEGHYANAAQRFFALDTFIDSADRYMLCRSALAVEAWQTGKTGDAVMLLTGMEDDCEVQLRKMSVAITGNDAIGGRIYEELHAMPVCEDILLDFSEMLIENGRIGAGKRHTVGLRANGTVLSAGDNAQGQCEVGDWTDMVQVAAGAYHTVGLKRDGTVVATGNNDEGQCNVSEWTNIIAIAAGTADTVGLCADGHVVAAGMHADKVSGWHDVTAISAGSYNIGCIYGGGNMLSAHTGAQLDMNLSLSAISVCGSVCVGLNQQRTMVSSFEGLPLWNNMKGVYACETGIFGIDREGNLKHYFYRAGDEIDMTFEGKAVEFAGSGTHHVVLTEEGRVFAFGDNSCGQCNVSDWQLK